MSKPEYITVEKSDGYIAYKPFPLDTWTDAHDVGERLITHAFLLDCYRKTMGRTLTIIDASIQDKQQNKAMKDLVRGIYSDEMGFAADMCFDQEKVQKHNKNFNPEEVKPVSIEYALGVNERTD
jgi:hypothetical protein